MQYFDWLIRDWRVVRENPRVVVGSFMIGALLVWFLSAGTISNLQSEVGLLTTRLQISADGALGPLPEYSLGGAESLVTSSEEWISPTTARSVELDWTSLAGIDVQVVLRMRAPGSDSSWIEARILNATDGEVVATTDRHSGSWIAARVPVPRATGVKTYSLQVRGRRAGFTGVVQLRRATSPSRHRQ